MMLSKGLTEEQSRNFERLKNDPVYFYKRFFATEEEPEPHDYQAEVAKDLVNPDYLELVVLKGRQIGMSWTMGWLAAWYATMHENKTVLVVAFNLDQAQIILNYVKVFMSRLKESGLYDLFVEGASARNFRFTNGSKIISFGCTVPDAYNVRGQKADLLLIDEAAFIYDKMFPSITPTTSNTHGKTIFLSTAGSVGSYFYRKWSEGLRAFDWKQRLANGEDIDIEADEIPKTKSYTIYSRESPRLTPEKLEAERRALGEMQFKREYECVWAGTADQVFMHVPIFIERRMPTRSIKSCYAGIDVGKVNDPTVMLVIESHFAPIETFVDGRRVTREIPYRLAYGKSWERVEHSDIAADIISNIHPRFPSLVYSIDATGGFGDDLNQRLVNFGLNTVPRKVKMKFKNEMMLGSPAIKGLSEAFAEELLWINNDINDIMATELLFELNGYVASLMSNGLYKFESVVDRDHAVDALAHAWSAVQVGAFQPVLDIRRRRV